MSNLPRYTFYLYEMIILDYHLLLSRDKGFHLLGPTYGFSMSSDMLEESGGGIFAR